MKASNPFPNIIIDRNIDEVIQTIKFVSFQDSINRIKKRAFI